MQSFYFLQQFCLLLLCILAVILILNHFNNYQYDASLWKGELSIEYFECKLCSMNLKLEGIKQVYDLLIGNLF